MAKDATPDELTVVNDNFSNENHERIANILEEEWSAGTTLSSMEGPTDAHKSTIQTVYHRYMGVPGDTRTIEQIRDEYGQVKTYLEMREAGEIDLQENTLNEREKRIFQEGVRKGRVDAFNEGWDRALEQALERGAENVPRMTDNE